MSREPIKKGDRVRTPRGLTGKVAGDPGIMAYVVYDDSYWTQTAATGVQGAEIVDPQRLEKLDD
jgi:hypothetical protein